MSSSLSADFMNAYAKMVARGLAGIDRKELDLAVQVIRDSGQIFVAGNGGSAAIANHLVCDFNKGAECGLNVISLATNVPLMTAIANDFSYEEVFSWQLKQHIGDNVGHTVILISSSGNSPNIVSAANLALKKDATLIGFTGFNGGTLKDLAHINIHVPINNYGVVEDCHQIVMHMIAQYLKEIRDEPRTFT